MMNKKTVKLESILENLFNPINNKDYGLYWLVSNNKSKPLANASELLKYIRKEKPEGSFINRYTNLTDDLILENNIYLDFDLTNKDYLKAEKRLTLTVLEELAETNIENIESSNYYEKNNNNILKQIQQKYNENHSNKNGFKKGFNNFIDSLTISEEGSLKKLVSNKEKNETANFSKQQEFQQYYINKFEQNYLKEPFKDVLKVVKYFESIGIKTIINLSGSKGFHLRIPITEINFKDVPELAENPEAVKIFLLTLAELIETKIIQKPKGKSSLDYAVFKKGMQRIPTSQHNKTKLYANFIEPSVNYLEAIDTLKEKVPSYIPSLVNTEANTKSFLKSDIYKATIKLATEETTKTFKSEKINSNYKFKGKHKELLEIISKVYLPSCRNEVGFRIVHLLRRSNFKKSEVEDIFKELHEDPIDYKKTIQGSINHAYKTEKLVGLRSLIKWLKDNASTEVKTEVINYFKNKFNYYESPEKTILKEPIKINGTNYNIVKNTTSNKTYYTITDFITEDYTLEINKNKNYLFIKHNGTLKAKLELKKELGIKPKSKEKLTNFVKKIEKRTDLKFNVVEAIEDIDLILEDFEDKTIEKEKSEEIIEEISEEFSSEESDNKRITFGNTEEGYYSQSIVGIYYHKPYRNAKGDIEEKVDPVANVVIKDVEIILDSLGVLEPVYNVTYYNRTFRKEETVEYLNKKQLNEEFIKANVFYSSTKENVETVLNNFIIDGTKAERIKTKTEAYLEGFYIVNGKVIENTKLKNIKNYTSEDVAEAINLLNEIMKGRTEEGRLNDSTVYRFCFWNPYSYCLKQLGLKTGLYSLILIGISKGNKTGAINIGSLFYDHKEEENSGSTVSVLGSKLEENSFFKSFDECYNLINLPEAPDVMKKAVQDKVTRITKNRTDNKKSDVFNAFGLPIFLLNERMEFKDYIRERYKITEYTSKSYVSKEKRTKFNEKYLPEAEDTILKKLVVLGAEFKKKIVPLIEAKDKRLLKIEELTIQILKEIVEETTVATGKPIDFLPEMYLIKEASTNYNYDVASEIIKLLNTEFKNKNKLTANSSYSGFSFTNSIINNDFEFITYNKYRTERTIEKEFIIDSSGLVKYVNNHVEETVELETILEALGLTDILKTKAKATKTPYNKFINKQHKIKVEGTEEGSFTSKNITGFYLNVEELANKLFSFNIDFLEKNDN